MRKNFADLAPVDVVASIERGHWEAGRGFNQVRSDIQQLSRVVLEVRDAATGGDPLAVRMTDYARLTEDGSPRAALKVVPTPPRRGGARRRAPWRSSTSTGTYGLGPLALGEDEQAMALLRRSCEAYPDYPNAQASLAMLHLLEGRKDEEVTLARAALAGDPKLERAALVLIDGAPPTISIDDLEKQLSGGLLNRSLIQLALSARAHRTGDHQASLRHAEADGRDLAV